MGDAQERTSSPTIDEATFDTLEEIFNPDSPLSPTGTLPQRASITGFASPHVYAPSNAVHMEIQENSKLPTFNLSVDRSNGWRPSAGPHRRSSGPFSLATRHDLDEMLRLSENDVSLTEMFLGSSDRSSRNLNYGSVGALWENAADSLQEPYAVKESKSAVVSDISSSPHSSPTMAKGASNTSNGLLTPPSSPIVFKPLASPSLPFPLSPTIIPNSYYPYGRLNPLPIPKAASPDDTAKKVASLATPLQDALKTAAAIALTDHSSPSGERKEVANTKHSPLPPSVAKKTAAPSISILQPMLRATAENESGKFSSPSHATDRSRKPVTGRSQKSPTESILEATKRRSQFGFGENHVVPSVPLPPPSNGVHTKGPAIPSLVHHASNSAAAYERKKQRAKDARIKLNESIDDLAVAINLAGTETSQRAAQMRSLAEPASFASSRQNLLQVMDTCVEEAENAKKWDRPSFVGSAATLLQSLNAQCEALTRELLLWRKQANGSQQSRATPANKNSSNSGGKRDRTSIVYPSGSDSAVPAKRQRLESEGNVSELHTGIFEGKETFASLRTHRRVTKRIASLLDPRSLLRCLEVSRQWRELGVFQSDEIWLEEAINRFGAFNVRQWKAKLDDHDQKLSSCPIKLYNTMDSANIRPYSRQEGSLLLGEARMPGKVSAWVSMVERSNGETFRSVKKESNGGSGQYSSLPVIELRILIQNTGMTDNEIVVKDQVICVDASTRRRGEEMKEIEWDDRLQKSVLNLDGSLRQRVRVPESHEVVGELCRLRLFDAVVLVAHINARGCSTTSKFQHKANFTKVLVTINGTTVPLVIPFFRDTTIT